MNAMTVVTHPTVRYIASKKVEVCKKGESFPWLFELEVTEVDGKDCPE